jgi:alkanesulfonate monooxygenase SsuD/methylene tetrahydromethanopterin reductase-like flavin-dependent oxidoreductase (luciferase family)
MPVDFGLALVESHPKSDLNYWMNNLEQLLPHLEGKFKSLWMTDHLFWNEDFAYEVWTVLSYLAAKFPAFDVGPMVMGQNYRNPALVAKMASTLQQFSHGRFIMGIGAGWKEDEYRGYGYDMPSAKVRLEQLEDSIEIMKRLWTQPGKVSYQGKHYHIQDAILEPKPVPVPPVCVGVKGDNALKIVARQADWWNVSDVNIRVFKDRSALLDRYCGEIGRDPKSIRRTWFGRVVTGRTDSEIHRLANSWKMPFTTENAFVGTPAQIVEQMAEFVAAGCDYFMIDILGLPDQTILYMVLNDIIPAVRKLG